MPDNAGLLKTLRQSKAFAPEFLGRPRFTNTQLAQLPQDQRPSEFRALGSRGTDAERELEPMVHIVDCLGRAKYEPAVETLAQLWRECDIAELRHAAAKALRRIGTDSSRAALIELLNDWERSSMQMAILAIFEAASEKAYDRLVGYFQPEHLGQPGGVAIAWEVLRFLAPRGTTPFFIGDGERPKPEWVEPRVPVWFSADARWLELCLRLRRDEVLGLMARRVLVAVEPATFEPVLAVIEQQETAGRPMPRTQPFGDLVQKYRAGEHLAVWQTLRSLPAIDGQMREEALAVAMETMQRFAHNIDLLAVRLEEKGWVPLSGRFRTKSTTEDASLIARLESITKGPIPPSLLAFWQVVGGVNFVWDYGRGSERPKLVPGLDLGKLDPLLVNPPASMAYDFERWEEDLEMIHPDLFAPFGVYVAPDAYHKRDVSGGDPYSIELPFTGADPKLKYERHSLPFVDYLRLCMRWAGFPDLERHANESSVVDFVNTMTKGFEPF